MAFPLKAISSGRDCKESALFVQRELSVYKEIETVVIGLPLLLNGKEGEMAVKVREFAAALEEKLKLPIVLLDERLTSQQVDKLLKSAEFSRKERAQMSDVGSAATLLDTYLQSKNP